MGDLLDIKRKECYLNHRNNGDFQSNETFCKLVFDGIMCWPASMGGQLVKQPCPTYIISSQGFATKKCENNGEWYVDKDFNRSWTNYSQCWKLIDDETALVNFDSIENSTVYHIWFPIIKHVSQSGYVISLIALIIAMIIFISIKKLQCTRNKLHMHLFASFILRAFMSLLKDSIFVEGVAMKSDLVYNNGILKYTKEHYSWICKAIISVRNYFIIANYMLMLMEGIYLHNLLFLTICNDQSRITVYYMIGWGLPLLFITPWILVRLNYEDTMCWTTSGNKNYLMLLHSPIAVSIVHQRSKYRRLVRSTLILIPLFGVPYVFSLIISFTTTTNTTMEAVWIFLDQTFTAFQGLFVALVYCLLNSEVHTEIKHKYYSLRDRRQHNRLSRERTISHTLQFPTTIIQVKDEIGMNNLGGDC